MNLFVSILAGGSGTRFWPASTKAVPKQFLPLAGGAPLLRETYDRVAPLVPAERVCVVTSAQSVGATRRLLPEIPAENVLGEPAQRNTAPACAIAALWARARSPDAVLLTLPADHYISPAAELRAKLLAAATRAATAGSLVTLGLAPTRAATGYGWIQLGERVDSPSGDAVHRVAQFVEKPDRARAEEYLARGGYVWNLGMFAWRADAFLAELGRLLPDVAARTAHWPEAGDGIFEGIEPVSVDRGVLERAASVDCLPCSFEWDDVGSFEALARRLPKDAGGNCTVGPLVALDARDCVAWTEDGHMTALLGVDNLIVVHAHGATLVAHRTRAEDIRKIVEELGRRGLDGFA